MACHSHLPAVGLIRAIVDAANRPPWGDLVEGSVLTLSAADLVLAAPEVVSVRLTYSQPSGDRCNSSSSTGCSCSLKALMAHSSFETITTTKRASLVRGVFGLNQPQLAYFTFSWGWVKIAESGTIVQSLRNLWPSFQLALKSTMLNGIHRSHERRGKHVRKKGYYLDLAHSEQQLSLELVH